MALPVVHGATTMCTMGAAPGLLQVLPKNRSMIGKLPVATTMDNIPLLNIMPFVLCNSLANPVTAAQTAAALGILTPGACTPVVPAPWAPGSPTVKVANLPGLTNSATCSCAYGGQISITFSGTTTTTMA